MQRQIDKNFTRAKKSLMKFFKKKTINYENRLKIYNCFVKTKLEYGILFSTNKNNLLDKIQEKENTLKKPLLNIGKSTSTKRIAAIMNCKRLDN